MVSNQSSKLILSDIQASQQQDEQDVSNLLKTGAFTREMMMGNTIKDLGNTLKEVNQSGVELEEEEEDEEA